MVADGVRHAFQQFGAFANSSRYERTAQINFLVGKHLALAIQRQVIAVFAAQDVGHQRGPHKTLWNGAAWHLGLNNGLTTGAGQPRAANLVHDVMAVLLENDSLDHFLTRLTIFQLFHYIGS